MEGSVGAHAEAFPDGVGRLGRTHRDEDDLGVGTGLLDPQGRLHPVLVARVEDDLAVAGEAVVAG